MKTFAVLLLVALALSIVQGKYRCPHVESKVCVVKQNQCCKASDCPDGELCCVESCGNVCRPYQRRRSDGRRAMGDPDCEIDIPF
ncbi:hypothetical protein AVEN_202212-1 [Araneus ventricosus]|uniref:WAP domain-containing protein n=1 Tax=Araneus ventricosus TaxID=182803 RepID=A0A4Y2PB36_ARAVE|nr:hypothetical protein AVEN_21672-1 [Araneus ventricosus]GBN39043.1 hypothetical protein AVEN_65393-1 [Araneus ventricosus]GBN47216.1 hypothetical protein AVEN_202212-1 [Araneus ventricosus]